MAVSGSFWFAAVGGHFEEHGTTRGVLTVVGAEEDLLSVRTPTDRRAEAAVERELLRRSAVPIHHVDFSCAFFG